MKEKSELLELLESDVPAFNKYRGSTNYARIDLSHSNLSYSNLEGSDLRNLDLSYSNLRHSNLSYSNLKGSDFSYSDFSHVDLSCSNLSYSNLTRVTLRSLGLEKAISIFRFNKSGGRECYAVVHGETLMIHAGCFWGTLKQFEVQAKEQYGDNENENYCHQIAYLKSIEKNRQNGCENGFF